MGQLTGLMSVGITIKISSSVSETTHTGDLHQGLHFDYHADTLNGDNTYQGLH